MKPIHVSPRRMCECGKTILKLSEEEKIVYDEIVRRSDERSRKEREDEVTVHGISSEQSE